MRTASAIVMSVLLVSVLLMVRPRADIVRHITFPVTLLGTCAEDAQRKINPTSSLNPPITATAAA